MEIRNKEQGKADSTWQTFPPARDYSEPWKFSERLWKSSSPNDVASTAKEVLVVLRHSPLRLLERVPYITASGRKVSTVVTTKGVFDKMDGELVLTGYIPQKGKSEEQIVEEIKSTIGWELKIAKDLRREEIPLEKLMMLRYFDPDRCFLN